jgi:tetratricopeptide (TPR) repeat protein
MFYLPLQSSILNSVRGTITDKDTGEPIPGVKIIIEIETIKYELVTDKKGYFYKSGLKNGTYQVKYEKDGYIPAVSSFHLGISETKDISVQLQVLKEVKPVKKSLMRKGVELLNAGKYTDAVETLTKAIEETPENPVLYYYRGFSYDKSGDTDKALADHKKALDLDPGFLLSLSEAGKIFAKKRDLNNAVTYYKKAYDLGTTDVLALYNYGVCLINLGNSSEALKVFEKLISLAPHYADAYYQLGIIYLGLNDNARAKEYLQKFVDMDPENTNASVAKEILKTLD